VPPDVLDSIAPEVTDHVAGEGVTVRSTRSPTPIRVRPLLVGTVTTVCDVIVHAVGEHGAGPEGGVDGDGPEFGGLGVLLGI
jgi:hypothetical protein